MIDREALAREAVANQTSELNVAREYCQHLFLGAFYRQHGTERVMFKGGTALRVAYGSPRFSEDLDFSGFGVRQVQVEGWALEAASEIGRSGVDVDFQESKATSGGYLAQMRCRVHDLPAQIQVEVSLRQRNGIRGRGVLVTPDLLPGYTLTLLPEAKLVEEKLAALLTRGKPRDFFDLYFLLRKGLVPPAMKPQLVRARELLRGTRVDFKRELSAFLPRSHLSVVKDLRQALGAELQRHGV